MKLYTDYVKNRYGILESLIASNKRKCPNIAIRKHIFTFADLKNG